MQELYIDELRMFMGKEIELDNGICLHSPTINEITNIGEIKYNLYVNLLLFNRDIIQYFYRLDSEVYEQILHIDRYELFMSFPVLIESIKEALSFFCKADVQYHVAGRFFYANDDYMVLNHNNYKSIVKIVKCITGIQDSEQPKAFRNKKAQALYEQARAARHKSSKSESLRLRDILSILCNAEGNGIHIFNVGELTIYQVYEHFERLNLREYHTQLLQVWANGLLGKNEKLPGWMIKGTI